MSKNQQLFTVFEVSNLKKNKTKETYKKMKNDLTSQIETTSNLLAQLETEQADFKKPNDACRK